MLDEKTIGNDPSSLFNGNHYPSSASEAKLTNRRENFKISNQKVMKISIV